MNVIRAFVLRKKAGERVLAEEGRVQREVGVARALRERVLRERTLRERALRERGLRGDGLQDLEVNNFLVQIF